MTGPISFEVTGPPVPWSRARRKGNRYFNKPEMVSYQDQIAWAAKEQMKGREPLEGPIALIVNAWMPIPQSWSKKKRLAAVERQISPTTKPDLDNIVKQVEDALNKVVFKDDSQVINITASKRYCVDPRLVVTVSSTARFT